MNNYKYFEQEGSLYRLRSNNTTTKIRIALLTVIALALLFFVPREEKWGIYFGIIAALYVITLLLKATKKLTIDTSARTLTDKHNILTREKTYQFDDFVRFSMTVVSSSFIKTNHIASAVFMVKGKEKAVTLLVTAFTGKPAQRIINEASEITGFEEER